MSTDQDPYADVRNDAPGEAIFEQLNAHCDELDHLADELVEAEKAVAKIKDRQRLVAEGIIPELMESIGLEDLTTTSGLKVALKEKIFCSTSPTKDPERHAKAMDWLNKHGYGNIIKRTLSVYFNKGQDELSQHAMQILREELDLDPKQEQVVHPSTLRSFISKLLKDGEEFPMDLFGVEQKKIAVIK